MTLALIPRLIHQIWIPPEGQSDDAVRQEIVRRSNQWQELHSEFMYRLWSVDDVLRVADAISGPRIRSAVAACRFPAAKADIARLVLLREFGGFYADLKLEPKMSFLNTLISYDLVLTEHFPKSVLPNPTNFFINSFLGCQPREPFIDRLLCRVLTNVENRMQCSVFEVTGPANITALIKSLDSQLDGALGRVRVLRYTETWDCLFSVGGAPYSHLAAHWSERERTEPMYTE